MRFYITGVLWLLLPLLCADPVCAQNRKLVLQVFQLGSRRPIKGVRLISGAGVKSNPTDSRGRTWILLDSGIGPGDPVSLNVAKQPDNEWVLVQPDDETVVVPSFRRGSNNPVKIRVARRGDPVLLINGIAITGITARIIRAIAPRAPDERITDDKRKIALLEQANAFGHQPEEVDRAIRSWGQRTKSQYAKGPHCLI